VNSSGPFAGQFDTLIAAVLAADPAVVQRLTAKRQSTVFAPTDGAFEALGLTPANIGTLDEGALTQILLYHVVNVAVTRTTCSAAPSCARCRAPS